MAREKTLRLHKGRAEEFLKSLDNKASDRSAFIYQAIIVSLIAHIFILFTIHMLTEDNRLVEEQGEYIPLEMDMLDPETPLPEQPPQETNPRAGELKNLTANENSEQTNEQVNYRGKTQQQINEEVYNNLKNMESEEFQRLKEGRPDMTVQNRETGKTEKNSGKTNEYDWYKKGGEKSYSGKVSASFNLKGRDPLDQPKPTYRCKTQGTVVVKIKVAITGEVTDAEIDETRSAMDDCLRTESQRYALKWKFDYQEGVKKQDGTITFTFSAQ